MGQESGAPRRASTTPARQVARCGLWWRARDLMRQAAWQGTVRPLLMPGLGFAVFGAMVLGGAMFGPSAQRDGAGEDVAGGLVLAIGMVLCSVRRRT